MNRYTHSMQPLLNTEAKSATLEGKAFYRVDLDQL